LNNPIDLDLVDTADRVRKIDFTNFRTGAVRTGVAGKVEPLTVDESSPGATAPPTPVIEHGKIRAR
jgi:hypothetical protein